MITACSDHCDAGRYGRGFCDVRVREDGLGIAVGWDRTYWLSVRETVPAATVDSFHGTQIYPWCAHDKENVMTMPRLCTDGFDMVRPGTSAGIKIHNEPDFYERDSVADPDGTPSGSAGASKEATGQYAKLRSGLDQRSRGRGGVNNASAAAGGVLSRCCELQEHRREVKGPMFGSRC